MTRISLGHERVSAVVFAALLTVAAPAGSGLAADVTPMERPAANTPVGYFGYSMPQLCNLARDRPADLDRFLDVLAFDILGEKAVVRTAISWVVEDGSNVLSLADLEKCDLLLDELRARGLRWLPTIFPTSAGRGGLPVPKPGTGFLLDDWQFSVAAAINRYKPGGSYTRSATPPGAPDRRLFPGVKIFNIWNEPDLAGPPVTGTEISDILIRADLARDNNCATDCKIAGPSLSSIDLRYISGMSAALSRIDTLTLHVYTNDDPAACLPGPRGTLDWNAEQRSCIKSLVPLREWLDSNGFGSLHLGMTEGGTSGSPACTGGTGQNPPNVITLQQQSNYNSTMVAWLRGNPGIDFDFFIPFNWLDQNNYLSGTAVGTPRCYVGAGKESCDNDAHDVEVLGQPRDYWPWREGGRYKCDGSFWANYHRQNLGAWNFNPNSPDLGAPKPWATSYRTIFQSFAR